MALDNRYQQCESVVRPDFHLHHLASSMGKGSSCRCRGVKPGSALSTTQEHVYSCIDTGKAERGKQERC